MDFDYLFLGGRVVKLYKKGMLVKNATSPVELITHIGLATLECCLTPKKKIALKCVSALALLGTSAVSPNIITFGSAVHIITQIYEDCEIKI